MNFISIVYTGGASAKKIREASGNSSIYHTKQQGLKVFQSGLALSFQKGEVVHIWDNGKITKQNEEMMEA